MADHKTGTREQWLAARLELLEAEKELTRRSDELARRRQELPWVRIDKKYRFETDEGNASLADLFRGRSQLLVYHFMFGPDYMAGCPHCSAIADGFNGIAVHLANRDVMLWAASRAPLGKLQTYKRRMGWTFPWASSGESDFNFDFNVSYTQEQQRWGGTEYNYCKGGLTSRTLSADAREAEPEAAAEGPRAQRSSQWLFPATLLVLIPKCPLCVAAYVALFTGIGINVATARCLPILMLAICLTLAYLAVRHSPAAFSKEQ